MRYIVEGPESQKGGSAMNFNVTLDWKFVTGLGVAGSLLVLSSKVDAKSAGEVLTHIVDASRDYVIAVKSSH